MRTEHADISSGTAEGVLRELGRYAVERGYTAEGYVEALLDREADFPTGLSIPDASFGVAIPHADPDLVEQEAVLLGLPSEPVAFDSMDDPDESVDAAAVLLLIASGSDGYNAFLSNLADLFQADGFIEAVRSQSSERVLELVEENCL